MNARNEDGWVMVPAIVLLVVALGFAFALLAIVDTQTSQSRQQRSTDAAQTLAEGVVTATANVLAADATSASWPTSGACETITGDLTTAPTGNTSSLAYRVTTEVQTRFSGSSPEYATSNGRSTSWKVNVCPDSFQRRWNESLLTTGVPAAVTPTPTQISMWVRGQARVRVTNPATPSVTTRAVATKVKQSEVVFTPPKDYALGTGSLSTEVTGTVGTLTSTQLNRLLGTNPLIADATTKIGARCGLLSTLDNPASVCLSGTLAGSTGVTNATGLDPLNTLLGTDRFTTLATWNMAPADAVAAWKAEAQNGGGIYLANVSGSGDVRNAAAGPGSAPECFTDTDAATAQVVYIGTVGNGEQYCKVTGTRTEKILIVERGGVVIQGAFTGVVYGLNKQECTGDGGACSEDDRENAVLREVARIEGTSGHVTGSVWADGAGGEVGIYPAANTPSLLASAATALIPDLCSLPLVGPLLSTVANALGAVAGLVGGVLGILGNTQEQVRYPDNASNPTGCQLLTAQLGTLTNSQLLTLFQNGGTVNVVTSERRTRTCTIAALSIGCGAWSAWTTRDTQTLQFPALTSDLTGALIGLLSNYTAVTGDNTVIENAAASIALGGGPDTGTYRNIAPN